MFWGLGGWFSSSFSEDHSPPPIYFQLAFLEWIWICFFFPDSQVLSHSAPFFSSNVQATEGFGLFSWYLLVWGKLFDSSLHFHYLGLMTSGTSGLNKVPLTVGCRGWKGQDSWFLKLDYGRSVIAVSWAYIRNPYILGLNPGLEGFLFTSSLGVSHVHEKFKKHTDIMLRVYRGGGMNCLRGFCVL